MVYLYGFFQLLSFRFVTYSLLNIVLAPCSDFLIHYPSWSLTFLMWLIMMHLWTGCLEPKILFELMGHLDVLVRFVFISFW